MRHYWKCKLKRWKLKMGLRLVFFPDCGAVWPTCWIVNSLWMKGYVQTQMSATLPWHDHMPSSHAVDQMAAHRCHKLWHYSNMACWPIFWCCPQVFSNFNYRLHQCQAKAHFVFIWFHQQFPCLNSISHFLSCSSGCLQWLPPCPSHLGPSCLSSYWVSRNTCCILYTVVGSCIRIAKITYVVILVYSIWSVLWNMLILKKKKHILVCFCLLPVVFHCSTI